MFRDMHLFLLFSDSIKSLSLFSLWQNKVLDDTLQSEGFTSLLQIPNPLLGGYSLSLNTGSL